MVFAGACNVVALPCVIPEDGRGIGQPSTWPEREGVAMQGGVGEVAVERLADDLRAARHGGRRWQVARRVGRLEPAVADSLAELLLGSCARIVAGLAGAGGPDPDAHVDALRRLLLRRCDGPRRRREVAAVIATLRARCGGAGPVAGHVGWTPAQLIDLVDVEHALGHAARVGAAS